jgi:Heterokaryon incompatibility protein (HET)
MELVLIVPVDQQKQYHGPTEWLNGTQWRVSEPLDINNPENLKYHCISYVWGGSHSSERLFQSKIAVSDQTKPALEAAMAAVDAVAKDSEEPAARAFWIDVICVPQTQGPKRNATLER